MPDDPLGSLERILADLESIDAGSASGEERAATDASRRLARREIQVLGWGVFFASLGLVACLQLPHPGWRVAAALATGVLILVVAGIYGILKDERNFDSLWLVVFASGTGLVLTFAPSVDQYEDFWVRAANLTPRLFVVWFLSALTLTAARLLSRLRTIQNQQPRFEATVAQTQGVMRVAVRAVLAVRDSIVSLKKNAEDIRQAGESMVKDLREQLHSVETSTRGLVDLAAKTIGVETELTLLLEVERELGGTRRGSATFLDSANDRIGLIRAVAGTYRDRRASLNTGNSAVAYDRVLLPSLLVFLGTDAWKSLDSRIGLVQEGSYLLYAHLIELLFRHMIEAGPQLQLDGKRFEVFTTLNVPPRMWYNVHTPGGWPPVHAAGLEAAKSFFDIYLATTPKWEHYRAVQALAVHLGRRRLCAGLTRCFIAGAKGQPNVNIDEWVEIDSRCWVPRRCLSVRDGLIEALIRGASQPQPEGSRWPEARDNMLDNLAAQLSGKDAATVLKVSDEEVAGILRDMETVRANELENLDCLSEDDRKAATGALGQDKLHRYPVLLPIRSDEQWKAFLDGQKSGGAVWSPLIVDCLGNYFTSADRALLWDISEETSLGDFDAKQLPLDVFAVGIASAAATEAALARRPTADDNLEWAFIVTLASDELGTTTRTEVLLPSDGDSFDGLTKLVNQILAGTESGTEGRFTVRPLISAAKLSEYEHWLGAYKPWVSTT